MRSWHAPPEAPKDHMRAIWRMGRDAAMRWAPPVPPLTPSAAPPQNLMEKIVRNKIYQTTYWKEHCFGLSAEALVDKAVDLKAAGGCSGGFGKPTPFLCLVLKMLQVGRALYRGALPVGQGGGTLEADWRR